MYKVENSVLTKDGKKVFAMGQSYYPSFHPGKFPVPPEGDRIGEMKKDLKMMREMGFNHVRFAAIGNTYLNDKGELVIDTPFVEAMIREAKENDMSVSVRLEGYTVNLRGFKDVLMVDAEGKEQDTTVWLDFIQNTFHHEGLNEDNEFFASEMAKHYAEFDNVVAYQIYNEPHYPGMTIFDYHPLTIKAYRKWLVSKGVMSEAEAENYMPPRTRKEQSPDMWALWRIFARDSLTEYLKRPSLAAKAASGIPTYTCYTACQAGMSNAFRGVDFFGGAEGMDVIGYTCYIPSEGSTYYMQSILMDMNASAAKLNDKASWCVELDSRTKISTRRFNKNTYNAVGAGAKGIVYYQWRGDAPSEATPIPNGCGLLNYDGSKTDNFDNAAAMVKLINGLSEYIVNAEPVSYGIGILHSDYAAFFCDALENNDEKREEITYNTNMGNIFQIYRDIRKSNLSASFVTTDALEENKLNIRVLFVPKMSALSDEERAAVTAFAARGGKVYELRTHFTDSMCGTGYEDITKSYLWHSAYPEFCDIAEECGIEPEVRTDNERVAVQVLKGDGYRLIILTNTSCSDRLREVGIKLNFKFSAPVFYSNDDEECINGIPAECKGNEIRVRIKDGGFVLVRSDN